MSGKATGWVLRNGPARKGHKAVLTAIADAADVNGENARIGWRAIAERASYSRARVATVVADLVRDGWVEVVDAGGPGRGRVTVYRLPRMARTASVKGPTIAPAASVKGPTPEPKRSNPEREKVQLAEVVPLIPTVSKTVTKNGATPHSDAVHALCEQLADRVASLRHGARPNVTERWLKDMRLLVERGPLHRDSPEAHPPGKIAATIDFVFAEMADPEGRGAFCWADQIRSPHALRDHWYQMARAAENKLKARRSPTAAILDRMSPGAGSTPLPVHLLPQTTSQRRAIR
jgi:hypothetical protein